MSASSHSFDGSLGLSGFGDICGFFLICCCSDVLLSFWLCNFRLLVATLGDVPFLIEPPATGDFLPPIFFPAGTAANWDKTLLMLELTLGALDLDSTLALGEGLAATLFDPERFCFVPGADEDAVWMGR
jgi:hypothetical protein